MSATTIQVPVGPVAPARTAVQPPHTALHGRYTSLIPLQSEHAVSIFKHLGGKHRELLWTYMLTGGFSSLEQCIAMVTEWAACKDKLYYAVLTGPATDPTAEPAALMTYMSVEPAHRRIEIGSVIFGEKLKRSRQATEASYLLARHAFEDLGYLRLEWKANKLNEASLTAAARLGFKFEGIFRNHMIIKGRRRDTAWFSITDDEWPTAGRGLEAWLEPSNFDEAGTQKRTLQDCREN